MINLSVKNNLWVPKDHLERDVMYVKQKYNISELTAKIILARNDNIEQIDGYLTPTIKSLLPDPFSLKDSEKAIKRIYHAIEKNEKIIVFGDYDVDGATSSALIARYFKMIGFYNFEVYIPDRIKEGYGPNSTAFKKFAYDGAKVIITVDCGTLAFEPILEAKKLGVDVIVIDHHLSDSVFPEALAIVNPNRLDEDFPHKNLAAVGVSFIVMAGLHVTLRQNNYFTKLNEPNILCLLDLVALGTVCDVMTITGLNRAFVTQGLKIISKRLNKGIAALCDVASLDNIANTYHLGFIIGPRINAGGRVGRADLGTKLLTSDDYDEAYQMALELDRYNSERKTIETIVLEEAIKQVEQINNNNLPLIFASGEGWHPGVIGIVCSRIKEKTGKPCAVIAFDNEIGKASARSIAGVDIGAKVVSAKNAGLLLAGGGHAMAAGFTVTKNKLDDLYNFLAERVSLALKHNPAYNISYYDGEISAMSVNKQLTEYIKYGEPYGNGNNEPLFKLTKCKVIKTDLLKGGTLRLILVDESLPTNSIKATIFKAVDTGMAERVINSDKKMSFIGRVCLNNFMMKESVEFYIEDIIFE
ncbi:MAG: single-stranded-DNA-specific exonuclease RecJ [Sphingobacteriia bacterium]|nr:single-stranded-DNA-specific exonuclease RecJ [Sphingobacteriia bacterium]